MIKNFYTKDANIATHLGITKKSRGNFHVDSTKKETYEILYKDIVSKKQGIVEKHIPDIRELLLYDIDLIFDKSILEENYENILNSLNIFIKNLIQEINKTLKTFAPEANLECHVCVKINSDGRVFVTKKKDLKTGIHIYYPLTGFFRYEILEIYENLLKSYPPILEKEHLYTYLVDKQVSKIIDKSVVTSNGLIIFGGAKDDELVYSLQNVYDNEMNDIVFKYKEKPAHELALYYSLHKNRFLSDPDKIQTDTIIEQRTTQEETKEEPPRFLYRKKSIMNEKDDDDSLQIQANKNLKNPYEHYYKVVMSLNPMRSEDYNDWLKIGICLLNSQPEEENFFEIWNEFSKQAVGKYDAENTIKTWKNLSKKKYTLLHTQTLYYFLKIDNPEKFDELKDTTKEETSSLGRSASIMIFEVVKNEYVCVSTKPLCWYHFDGLKWVSDDSTNRIFMKIDKFFKNMPFVKMTKSRMEEIIYFLKHYCFDSNFLERVDSRDELICFENGVFDLDKDYFRNYGVFDDYCLFTTKYDYKQLINCQEIQTLYKILEQILPDPDVRNYLLSHLSLCMHGKRTESSVIILTGSGANGKSFLMNLMSKALGDYYKQGSITLFTRKRGSSSECSPDLVSIQNKRMLVLNESEHDDVIYTSILKQLSGGDQIEARPLYKAPISFKPKAKIFITCNDLPKIPCSDFGTWRRLRVVNFPSKFVDNPNPQNENEFKKDVSLEKKVEELVPSFINILLKKYRTVKKNDMLIEEPDSVLDFTNKYQNMNDSVQNFIDNNLEFCEGNEISFRLVYQEFKGWFKENNGNKCPMSSTEFQNQMEKRNFYKKRKIVNYILKSEEEN